MLRTFVATLFLAGLTATAPGALAQSHFAQGHNPANHGSNPGSRLAQMDRDHDRDFGRDRDRGRVDRDRGREQAMGREHRENSNGRFGLDRDRGQDRAQDRRMRNDHDADDRGFRR